MEFATYAVDAEIEASHWWFVGRRRLFASELRRAAIPSDARVLDIGTSAGTNLRMLRELGFDDVTGLDKSEEAIRYCELKGLGSVRYGDACAMPFEAQDFDLIVATDIIQEIDDDMRALREIARVLRPGGKALITAPAFESLWGLQDRVGQHRRRYRLAPLRSKIEGVGLCPARAFYFNYFLFIPIWLARQVFETLKIELKSEGEVNTPLLNRVLSFIFTCDIGSAPVLRPPFGVSILLLASKPGG
jgi:SAM-dependent methyltransferase